MDDLLVVFRCAGLSVAGNDAARSFIVVAVLQFLLGHLFNEEVVQVLLALILFLAVGSVVDLHLVQLLQLLLRLLIELLLYLQL